MVSSSPKASSKGMEGNAMIGPYHGWRISHRTHHQNHGHVENDESWVPLLEKIYKTLDESTKILRFKVPFPMFAYPIYLVRICLSSCL